MAQEQRQSPDASLYSKRPDLALNRILDALRGMCGAEPDVERLKATIQAAKRFLLPQNQIFLPGGGRAALSFFKKYFIILFKKVRPRIGNIWCSPK